jgi:hypothetical protein
MGGRDDLPDLWISPLMKAALPMTRVLIGICATMLATESLAARYEVANKSCRQLRAIVLRDGAAILRWRSQRSGVILYERFVRNMAFCPAGQITDTASVPAADGNCWLPKCIELEDFYTFWD